MRAKELYGKKVKMAEVDGFGITMTFTDGTRFEYSASDGGYSSWHITKRDEKEKAEDDDQEDEHLAEMLASNKAFLEWLYERTDYMAEVEEGEDNDGDNM